MKGSLNISLKDGQVLESSTDFDHGLVENFNRLSKDQKNAEEVTVADLTKKPALINFKQTIAQTLLNMVRDSKLIEKSTCGEADN